MIERFISDPKTRLAQLQMARSELLCHPLWSKKYLSDPLWERLIACPFVFLMGWINLLSGMTGLYFGEAVSWLGWQRVCLKCWVEDVFGIETDPELSQRIVDPRHRLAALDAIEKSQDTLRSRSGL